MDDAVWPKYSSGPAIIPGIEKKKAACRATVAARFVVRIQILGLRD
jgi:hypothetical protein